ncbi:hypothetical protein LCGC14_0597200 [marine sediment metagenome]|uniref:Uncharacterized protein n=1 Tax=marine sediment metagenome TaxID=412755 RepID=A0A0F9RVI4_9ZZZZ
MIKKKLTLISLIIFIILFSMLSYLWYHGNKPIFQTNYVEDTFEDQITGLFPAGWFSIVNPLNVKVTLDEGNKVMEINSAGSEDVTEIQKKFKRAIEGIVECKVKILDMNTRFVIHIPQADREYNPYDDIIIAFLEGGIYIVGDENIVELETDPVFWERLIMLNDGFSWAIDEQSLEDSNPIATYILNSWYSIKIEFNRERFLLTINGDILGTFNYPKYKPSYFTSLYFVSFATKYDFKFYVDDVSINMISTTNYIHPLNIIVPILMALFLFVIILSYFKLSKSKIRFGKNKIIGRLY